MSNNNLINNDLNNNSYNNNNNSYPNDNFNENEINNNNQPPINQPTTNTNISDIRSRYPGIIIDVFPPASIMIFTGPGRSSQGLMVDLNETGLTRRLIYEVKKVSDDPASQQELKGYLQACRIDMDIMNILPVLHDATNGSCHVGREEIIRYLESLFDKK
jgi:hypothetical protein